MYFRKIIRTTSVCSIVLWAIFGVFPILAQNLDDDPRWGCYDPMPSHPTADERLAFIAEISPLAVEAERLYGVPAPAIAAMAIVESGYGFTRTALRANNLFGYKWVRDATGRPPYELSCQPASDPGNQYISFASRGESVNFVARNLAQSRFYKSDTDAFRSELLRGGDRTAAIRRWVVGIADPYNADPPRYAATIGRLMNDSITPSDSPSAERTLFRLMPTSAVRSSRPELSSTVASPRITARDADLDRIALVVGRARYMESRACRSGESPRETVCCAAVLADDPLMATTFAAYAALRVAVPAQHRGLQDCRYVTSGIETRVVMLNPEPRRVAEWTVSACTAARARSLDECARWVWTSVFSRSGTQFAVAGVVVEPNNGVCWQGPPAVSPSVGFTFRDGVTVRLADIPGVCDVEQGRMKAEPSTYLTRAVQNSTSGGPSRVTMLTRQGYAAFFGGAVPGDRPDSRGSVPWLRTVREAHMDALIRPDHPWLDRVVSANLPSAQRLR